MTDETQSEAINADLQGLIRLDGSGAGSPAIERALKVIRTHLKMDVAFVARFDETDLVFCHVDSDNPDCPVKTGTARPLEETYCQNVRRGALPPLICDTSQNALAQALPVTRDYAIGAYISAPITLPDGRSFGRFCCASSSPDHTLNQRDQNLMQAISDLTAFAIYELEAGRDTEEARRRIDNVLTTDNFRMVFQPIWDLTCDREYAFEALCRIGSEPARGPDVWLAEAEKVDRRLRLEIAALKKALAYMPLLPQDAFLSLNASPETVCSEAFAEVIRGAPLERIMLEITEHTAVSHYDKIRSTLALLRDHHLRLAVDDAGGGYASLSHILQLKPDIIKADMALIRNVDSDPARQALVSALVKFSTETSVRLIAEGVETARELTALKSLGVGLAQGYYLGRPLPLPNEPAPAPIDLDIDTAQRPAIAAAEAVSRGAAMPHDGNR